MKILLTGATGFVGQELGLHLARQGHQLHVLTRNPAKHEGMLPFPAKLLAWDADQGVPPVDAFEGVEAVIHLAGESIAGGRWNPERKQAILDSRVRGTRHLVEGIRQHGPSVRTFVSAAAVGIYGDRGDEVIDENSPPAEGSTDPAASAVDFLAGVCREWESSATEGLPAEVRSVLVRIGIVLGEGGGGLDEMLPIFKWGVGGALGSGRQWMSWIHLKDLVRIFEFALTQSSLRGPVNGVGPAPVTNAEFTRTLGQVVGKPAILKTPGAALRLALGGMAQAVLSSQRVLPKKLLEAGFSFRFSGLDQALRDLVPAPSDRVLVMRQWIPAPLSKVFDFFSSAHNLERITPPWLNFQVLTPADQKIQAGSLIDYRLRIHGIPVKWRTLIESWEPGKSFVDTQLRGPYRKWHHTHHFEEVQGGVLIEDRVLYRVPFFFVGEAVGGAWVRRDVEQIFHYRKKIIREIFAR
jgi:uncharacterized protein (TIGR01777 family)